MEWFWQVAAAIGAALVLVALFLLTNARRKRQERELQLLANEADWNLGESFADRVTTHCGDASASVRDRPLHFQSYRIAAALLSAGRVELAQALRWSAQRDGQQEEAEQHEPSEPPSAAAVVRITRATASALAQVRGCSFAAAAETVAGGLPPEAVRQRQAVEAKLLRTPLPTELDLPLRDIAVAWFKKAICGISASEFVTTSTDVTRIPAAAAAWARLATPHGSDHALLGREGLREYAEDQAAECGDCCDGDGEAAGMEMSMRELGLWMSDEWGEGISLGAFVRWVSDAQSNSIVNPRNRSEVYQDMTLPLHHYFVASSHNTYLPGHQLWGDSSAEPYRAAFELGCKCVEIDCWDGADGEPVVTHGHTFVKSVGFRPVIECVRDYGFVCSPFPVILSLEMHCSPPQQTRLAEHMIEVLGPMLVPFSLWDEVDWASPSSLCHKVLAKCPAGGNFAVSPGSPSPAGSPATLMLDSTPRVSERILMENSPVADRLDATWGSNRTIPTVRPLESLSTEGARGRVKKQTDGPPKRGKPTPATPVRKPPRKRIGSLSLDGPAIELSPVTSYLGDSPSSPASPLGIGDSDEDNELPQQVAEIRAKQKKTKAKKVSAELAAVVALPTAKFRSRRAGLDGARHFLVTSWAEGRVDHYWSDRPQRAAELSKLMFIRSYPSGARVSSDNYDPQRAWSIGIQLVALNYQTLTSQPLRVNVGRFRHDNGGCGYLVKPPPLRDPCVPWAFSDSCRLSVRVHALCGVAVSGRAPIHATATVGDATRRSRAGVVRGGGTVVWRGDLLELKVPSIELSVLVLQVRQGKGDDDRLLCETVLPVNSLRCGLRASPLWSETMKAVAGSLLVTSSLTYLSPAAAEARTPSLEGRAQPATPLGRPSARPVSPVTFQGGSTPNRGDSGTGLPLGLALLELQTAT
eukprot:TRINITY_DN25459_c0_g1_i1.p1 TRINITY_DN25459_c0_g1~~TRINITY_DN25459_c0_g1_i1.p1  ORF type:complete len:922 (+),score=161.64 TRINITY_DN25459_c0_g1_i1:47-2812(+)